MRRFIIAVMVLLVAVSALAQEKQTSEPAIPELEKKVEHWEARYDTFLKRCGRYADLSEQELRPLDCLEARGDKSRFLAELANAKADLALALVRKK